MIWSIALIVVILLVIVFLVKQPSKNILKLLDAIRGKQILTIGEDRRMARHGVIISFFKRGRKFKFIVNITSVKVSGLQFSSPILKAAKIIE